MGLLISEYYDGEKDELKRHKLILLLISERPDGWAMRVENYISRINKNSFYLEDIYHLLNSQYSFGYTSNKTLHKLKKLIKMIVAKHKLGAKHPSTKVLNKIPDGVLPKRIISS